MDKIDQHLIGDHILDAFGPHWYPIIIIVANMSLCFIAYQKRSLSFSGVIGTMIVGFSVFYYLSLRAWIVIILFFVSSTIIGKISRKARNKIAEGIQKKGGCRDIFQVFANGGPATILAILYGFTGKMKYIALYASAIAESTSDTWAGELGILDDNGPVSIINFKPVQAGLSGGVSKIGTISGFIGSLFIGISYEICFAKFTDYNWFIEILVISITGFIGCLADSLFGATIQGHYWDTDLEQITEKESRNGRKFKIVKGFKYIDNDMVNFLSNVTSILFALIVFH